MRIAHIDFGYSHPPQGGEQLRVDSVCGILMRKHKLRVLFPSSRKSEVLKNPDYSVGSFGYQYNAAKGERLFPQNRKVIQDIQSCIEEYDPEIIHHHFGTMPSLINAIIAGKHAGIPQVATFHQFWPLCYRGSYWDFEGNVCSDKHLCGECMLTIPLVKKGLSRRWRKMAKNILHEIGHHITYSKFMKDKLKKACVEAERITAIPFGVDFANIGEKSEKRKYIIFSGRITREKGVDLFLKALSMIKNIAIEAIIIGDGPQRKEFEILMRDLGVSAKFIGWVNDRKVYFEYLKGAICAVVPSLWIENSPLVIGEAFACETPVIGTNSGGIPELINNSGAGFVVERDADEIAGKIRILAEDKTLRKEMGRKGRAYAEENFNWETNVEKLVKVYEKVLSEG